MAPTVRIWVTSNSRATDQNRETLNRRICTRGCPSRSETMSIWGEPDDLGPSDGYVTEERAEQLFVGGAQASREMMARFI